VWVIVQTSCVAGRVHSVAQHRHSFLHRRKTSGDRENTKLVSILAEPWRYARTGAPRHLRRALTECRRWRAAQETGLGFAAWLAQTRQTLPPSLQTRICRDRGPSWPEADKGNAARLRIGADNPAEPRSLTGLSRSVCKSPHCAANRPTSCGSALRWDRRSATNCRKWTDSS
jgi:hypothetical protein